MSVCPSPLMSGAQLGHELAFKLCLFILIVLFHDFSFALLFDSLVCNKYDGTKERVK